MVNLESINSTALNANDVRSIVFTVLAENRKEVTK